METVTFQMILQELSRADYVRMANEPINEAEFILASILPEEQRASYEAKRGSMTIIPTMAGETGNDSPYVPTGDLELDAWSQGLAKFTATGTISENQQIEFQQMRDQLRLLGNQAGANSYSRTFFLNWMETWIRQAFRQQNEYLRGQALSSGQLVLRGGIIDLGVPAENKASYTSAQLWEAVRWGERKIKGIRARITDWDTLDALIDDPANKVSVVAQTESGQGNVKIVTLRKLVNNDANFSTDNRDSTQIVAYRGEGRIKLPTGELVTVPYWPSGTLSFIGNNQRQQVAQDGVITTREALGYTHVGPTVEGDGRPGVWMNGRVPDGRPYHVITEGAERVMTVLDEPKKLAIASIAT